MRKAWLCGLLVGACGGDDAPPIAPEVTDAVAYVDPTIGSGGLGFGYGSCFVGAAAPHGLVKLGPDTNGAFGTSSFQHYSGYFSDDDKIQGFSHVHLHGAGASDYGVLSVMPVVAFDPAKQSVVDYETRFAKADEHAAAGRYEVTLANGIGVVLAATQRAAVHHYTGARAVVVDVAKTLDGGTNDATITVDDAAHELTGQLHHLGGMSAGYGGYTLYFVARAPTTPWTSHQQWATGAALAVPATFDLAIGVSLVSIAGARANLDAEVPVLDVEQVAAATRAVWADRLGRVLLTGGSEDERRIFYTSLYHAFLMPSVIDDVDGTYQLIGQAAAVADGWHQVSDLSLWDTYRTVQPLYGWLAPESARDASRSLVAFAQGLGSYPRWPLAIGETGTMVGASADVTIADAVARGVAGAGGELGWPLLRAAAMDPTAPPGGRGARTDVESYMQYGYIPSTIGRSVSKTTEFAHDDFALAQLAAAQGDTADHDALIERSHGWRALYDPATGFLRGKGTDGTFAAAAGFDPLDLGDDYTEANAWHSLWMAGAHDSDGLVALLGGGDAAVGKLLEFFTNAKQDLEVSGDAGANFPRPYYWHGNEPDMNAAFLFAQFGRPDLTAEWVRWIEDSLYAATPAGVAGNDDGGTLGAWYVLATLGLYPVPGSDRWIIGAPRFPQARVLVGGHELAIVADGDGPYVQSVELDGAPVDGAYLTHAQLAGASTLRFVMAQSPP
jgi:putative alpha-1,2-mannosidase